VSKGPELGVSGTTGFGGLRTVRYWEADGVSGRRLMLRPFSKGSNFGKVPTIRLLGFGHAPCPWAGQKR